MDLPKRLNLMLAIVMLVVVVMGTLVAVNKAKDSVANESQSTARLAMQLVEAGLYGCKGGEDAVVNEISHLRQLEKIRHLRISVLGRYSLTQNMMLTNEKSGKDVPEWFGSLVKPEPIRFEKRIYNENGESLSIFIEGNAGDEIQEAWSEMEGFLKVLVILVCMVSFFISIMISHAFRSVNVILEGLAEIERGSFDKRLPDMPLPEFNRISQAFNGMAERLDKSRKEKKALVRKSLSIQEEERRYLARELHDELGQSLSVIKLTATTIKKSKQVDQRSADLIVEISDKLFFVVREMVRRLRPSTLDELGLVDALNELVGRWRAPSKELQIDLDCRVGPDEFSKEIGIAIIRIVQEFIVNTVKHAKASEIKISMIMTQGPKGHVIELKLSDDGQGFDQDISSRGFGLHGIRERVEGLDGNILIVTAPGSGVKMDITIPVQEFKDE